MVTSISCVIKTGKLNNSKKIGTKLTFCLVIFICILIGTVISVTTNPTWSRSTRITAGQHKAIIQMTTSGPGTYTSSQTLFNALSGTPSVLLALEGYKQDAAPNSNTQIGFKITITSATSTVFDASIRVYGANMYYYYFSYFAVQYHAILMPLYIQHIQKQFSPGNNLMESTASSRIHEQVLNYLSGETYSFPGHTIVQQAYIAGFKYAPKTNGNAIILNTEHVNQNQYTLNIQTKGDTIISEVCFYRLGFDKTYIMDGNVNIIDTLPSFQGTSSAQHIITYFITPYASFQYRNFIMGWYHIEVSGNYQLIEGNVVNDFVLQMVPGSSQVIYGSGNYERLISRTFHHTIRTCTVSEKYYHAVDYLCYDNCPNYYFNNNTREHCQSCHYSCKRCDGSALANQCLQCDAAQGRVYSSNDKSCVCQTVGRYQAGVTTCGTCASRCYSCSGSGNNACTGCSGLRSLQNNQCVCDSGYYDDGSATGNCVPCSLDGCLQCSFSGTEICAVCDTANKFEINGNTCICTQGFFLGGSGNCQPCNYRCSSCSDGTTCDSCSLTLHHRVFPSTGTLCICSNEYFQLSGNQQSVCQACQLPCLTCSGSSNICLSCNMTTHDFNSGNNKCVCKNGLADIGNGLCGGICGDGILTAVNGQQCDDRNTANQDGCSSECKIEENHNCVEGVESYSVCYYAKQVGLKVQEIYKQPFQNSVRLVISIDAPGMNKQTLTSYLQANIGQRSALRNFQVTKNQWEKIDYQQVKLASRLLQTSTSLQLSVQPTSIDRITYDVDRKLLSLFATYYADVSFENAHLILPPSSLTTNNVFKYFFLTPASSAILQSPYNNIPTTFYQEGAYSSSQALYYLFLAITVLYFVFFLAVIALRISPIAIESLLVFQVSYFGLLAMNSLDIAFSGLAFWGKYSAGINFKIGQTITFCAKAHSIAFYCALSDNLNFMIYLQTLLLIIYTVVIIYSNHQISKVKKQNLQILSLKESLLEKDQIQKQQLKMLNRKYASQKDKIGISDIQQTREQKQQTINYNSQKLKKINENSMQPEAPNNMQQFQETSPKKQYQFKDSALTQYLKKLNDKGLNDVEKQQMKNMKLFKYQEPIGLRYVKVYCLQGSYATLLLTTISLGVSMCFMTSEELGLSIFNVLLIVANLIFLAFLWVKIWKGQLIEKGDQAKPGATKNCGTNLQERDNDKSVSSYLTKRQLVNRNYKWSGLQLSFKQLIKEKESYVTFEFVYYPFIVLTGFIGGIFAATVGSYLYYCPILVVSLVFAVLMIKFGVFQERIHNFRAAFNLIAIFIICMLELISNAADLGANVVMSVFVLLLLTLTLTCNIFCVIWVQVRNRKVNFKQNEEECKQKKYRQDDDVSNMRTLINQANLNPYHQYGVHVINPAVDTLRGDIGIHEQELMQRIKNKTSELKQIKKQIEQTERTTNINLNSQTQRNVLQVQHNQNFEDDYGQI